MASEAQKASVDHTVASVRTLTGAKNLHPSHIFQSIEALRIKRAPTPGTKFSSESAGVHIQRLVKIASCHVSVLLVGLKLPVLRSVA